jgi:GxxExxY protein
MLSDLSGRSAITRAIIGCAIRVHTAVGPGVYENVYYECMKHELRHEGLRVELQRAVPIVYRDVQLSARYYVDLIVEEEVIVELKVVATLAEIHVRQLMTYLRLTGLPVGLLINFNVPKLVDGVKRVINPGKRL